MVSGLNGGYYTAQISNPFHRKDVRSAMKYGKGNRPPNSKGIMNERYEQSREDSTI